LINRRTVFEGAQVISCKNLPGFNIESTEDGLNSLSGEETDYVKIKKIDIWSLD
jgi:hypothetical protein